MLATFQENPTQLARIAGGFGWDFDDSDMHVLGRSPVDLYVDEWVVRPARVRRTDERAPGRHRQSRRSPFRVARRDPLPRDDVLTCRNGCARRGVSLMMTHESIELFRVTRLSEIGMSHLADNVVVLQYLRAESEVKRALLVLKTRASEHHPEIREFQIRPEGIVLGERFNPINASTSCCEYGRC